MRVLGAALGLSLLVLLCLPVLALGISASPAEVLGATQDPLFLSALWLSLRTTLLSLGWIVLTGTPLAWWLSRTRSWSGRAVELLISLPIVIPPAVVGVGLLQAFGQQGVLAPILRGIGVQIPFTPLAVMIAQVVVAAPFYVQAAVSAFREVNPDLLTVARTLGASPTAAFFRVAVPMALPGLVAGASLAWARALGEFGATLLFAGSLPGRTQTLPLAIFAALETDVRLAVVFSLVLAVFGVGLLLSLRGAPWLLAKRSP